MNHENKIHTIGYKAGKHKQESESQRSHADYVRPLCGRQQDPAGMDAKNISYAGYKHLVPPDFQHRFILICPQHQ